MKCMYHWRAVSRRNYARAIGDRELVLMLLDELAQKVRDKRRPLLCFVLSRFAGVDVNLLPIGGHEMGRLLRRLGLTVPDFYKERELYFLPLEVITELLLRVNVEVQAGAKP